MSLCDRLYVLGVVAFVGVASVGAIISKSQELPSRKPGPGLPQNRDTQASATRTIDRDYLGGYEDNYDHGGLGLTAHSSYGYNHDIFGGQHHDEPHLHHHHLHHVHKYHDESAYQKALAIKGLLAPLAGVALLGAAAAFVSNPILLQLGVISGAPLGRRKREVQRGPVGYLSQQDEIRLKEIRLLERFMAQVPKKELEAQEKKMVANLLSCTGLSSDSFCLQRLACELSSTEAISMPTEANVLAIILNDIFNNNFVNDKLKRQISNAIQKGRQHSACQVFTCPDLEKPPLPTRANGQTEDYPPGPNNGPAPPPILPPPLPIL